MLIFLGCAASAAATLCCQSTKVAKNNTSRPECRVLLQEKVIDTKIKFSYEISKFHIKIIKC